MVGVVLVVAFVAVRHRMAVGALETADAVKRRASPDPPGFVTLDLTRRDRGRDRGEIGSGTGPDHIVVARRRPDARVLEATLVNTRTGGPSSSTLFPISDLEDPPEADVPDAVGLVARRIAARARRIYGLKHTLSAPLTTDAGVIGAIVASRRTAEAWPESAQRILTGAAIEASAAWAYSHREAEARASTDASLVSRTGATSTNSARCSRGAAGRRTRSASTDMAALHAEFPEVGWHSYLAWAQTVDWDQVLAQQPSSGLNITARAEDEAVLEVSESIWPADRVTIIDEYLIYQESSIPDDPSQI